MPATVRVGPTELVSAIRRAETSGPVKSWLEAFSSHDDGQSWTLLSTPEPNAGEGNPGSLLTLADGRLALIYGYRLAPFGIRARLSSDNGRTWTDPVALRSDAGGRDIGYVRSVIRPDGKIVSIYYYHDKTAPARYLAATIWEAGTK